MIELKDVPIHELIPHSPPMVLLDRILQCTETHLVAEVSISKNSMFFDSRLGGVPTWAAIEYMAQAIAAFAGVRGRKTSSEPKLGFLLGTRKYNSTLAVLPHGRTFQIAVTQVMRDESGLGSFNCHITCNDEPVCDARVNVFEVENTQAFFSKEGVIDE